MSNLLRPQSLEEFVGQNKIKTTIKVMISSSVKRKASLDHTLLVGKPGLGKTSLATVIAKEKDVDIRYSQGPLLEKKADILALFGSIRKGQIVFIDEIHAISKNIEELLYSIMEDNVIDVQIGPEGDSKFLRIKIPEFTLIGATTKSYAISKPLKDRFGILFTFKNYSHGDIVKVLKFSSSKLETNIDNESMGMIANVSDNTPRIANNLLKRCIDFMIHNNKDIIVKDIVDVTFANIGIYHDGLKNSHVEYINCLNDNFYETSVSINNITNLLNIPKQTIISEIEPFLISKGYIEISSAGRRLTNKAIYYMQNKNNHN